MLRGPSFHSQISWKSKGHHLILFNRHSPQAQIHVFRTSQKDHLRAREMAELVKLPATKTDDLSSVPMSCGVGGENQLLQAVH